MTMLRQKLESVSAPGKSRYFLIVSLSYLLIGMLVALSMAWEYERIGMNFEATARERAVALFRQLELMREWNLQYGDIFGPTTTSEGTAPQSTSGRAGNNAYLTEIHPEHMLRQLAELATLSENAGGIRYHLVSRHSNHPAAQPDAWEAESLRMFEQAGIHERLVFDAASDPPSHRYIAPLTEIPNCLKCLRKEIRQREDSIAGYAIGIVIPAGKLMTIRTQQIRHMLLIHVVSFILIAGLLHLVARRTYHHLDKAARISADQQSLIEERTADLSIANVLLAGEVDERRHQQELLQESESRYRSVLESTHDGIAVAKGSRLTFANSRLAEMLGQPIDAIVGAEWIDFVHPDDRETTLAHQAELMDGGNPPGSFRIRMLHRDPALHHITVDLHVAAMKGIENAEPQWVLSVNDVSDKLRAEHDQQLAAAVFDSTAEAIMVTDHTNRIIMVNPAFTRITGYSAEEAIGKYPTLLQSGRHDKQFFIDMWQTIKKTGHWAGEIWNRRKDGHLYVEWLSITAVRNSSGEAPRPDEESNYVGTFTDITKRKEAEDLLRHKASHDLLTDLPNRSLFEDRLQLAISQSKRYHRRFALLYIDFDHFKEVNDTLGHAAGDELLAEAARRMSLCIRESDTLSRFGGDEFAAILTDVEDIGEVEDVAERMVKTLAEPFRLTHGDAEISGSIGIAIYPDHGTTAEQLKYNADTALYNVKQNQRNAYCLYSGDMVDAQARKG